MDNDKRVKTEHPMAGDRTSSKNKSRMGDVLEKMEELQDESSAQKEMPQVSSDLKNLIIFGKVTETVNIGGYSIVLSTLNIKQQRKLISEVMKLSNEDRLILIKIYTLAEAIISINSVPFDEMFVEGNISDPFHRKVEIISNLQATFIESLHNKYESLYSESKEYFKTNMGEQIKK